MKQNLKMWRVCTATVVVIAIALYAFILKGNISEPFILGFPFVMWMGMLVTIILVGLTFFAKSIFPFKED